MANPKTVSKKKESTTKKTSVKKEASTKKPIKLGGVPNQGAVPTRQGAVLTRL